MLRSDMSLDTMVKFEPSDIDMFSLPLEAVLYLKVTLVSLSQDDNYDFIRFLFSDDEIHDMFNNINRTIFYDFDSSENGNDKFITIFELTSKVKKDELSIYLEEILENYNHEAFVVMDFFSHDNKKYRLSDFDGLIKFEELH